jgi:hypothetical protein
LGTNIALELVRDESFVKEKKLIRSFESEKNEFEKEAEISEVQFVEVVNTREGGFQDPRGSRRHSS